MPRPARLRVPALAQFVEGQRYTPLRAIERQVERIEDLALELEPGRMYPEDWVVARITGFRPSIDEPRMIVGEALRADLGALGARLSDQAHMTEDSGGGPGLPGVRGREFRGFLSVEALCERWGVSRRTIDRYHELGLVRRRVRVRGGRIQVRFAVRHVERFEAMHADVIGRGASFRRVDERSRARMVHLAQGYMRRLGWSRQQAIGRIAVRLGVARETVRRVLQQASDAPEVVRDGALGEQERRMMLLADDRWVSIGRIAARVGRSRASVHRILIQERVRRLGGVRLWVFAESPAASSGDAQRLLEDEVIASLGPVVARREVGPFLEEARAMPPVDAREERALFDASVALRARCAIALEGFKEAGASASGLDALETDLRLASRVQQHVVHRHLGLIDRMIVDRLGADWVHTPQDRVVSVHRVAMQAACEAAFRHDPGRGGRFGAPLGLAVNRALARLGAGESESEAAGRTVARRQSPIGEVLGDWTRWATGWSRWLDPPAWLIRAMERIAEAEMDHTDLCIAAYYGLTPGSPAPGISPGPPETPAPGISPGTPEPHAPGSPGSLATPRTIASIARETGERPGVVRGRIRRGLRERRRAWMQGGV
ncbi:MAG: hypothetical protein EA380_08830 [Phycisphaeraceae bacterium]|nr:MAG: hypothetical protein EA380_08830 [Phycisphaeraceae bacterium]